jgi:hypothetical protein
LQKKIVPITEIREEKLREGKRREELTTKFQLRSKNYAIGIKSSIFQLRSRNKTEDFPVQCFLGE